MNSPPPFSSLAVAVFLVTMYWWVIVLLPATILCGRYFYSSQVIQGYLEKAMSRDMGNIEEFYANSSGKYTRVLITSWSCCWERWFGVGCCLWFICLSGRWVPIRFEKACLALKGLFNTVQHTLILKLLYQWRKIRGIVDPTDSIWCAVGQGSIMQLWKKNVIMCQRPQQLWFVRKSTNREHIKERLREEVWKCDCFHEALGTSRIMEQAVPDASL